MTSDASTSQRRVQVWVPTPRTVRFWVAFSAGLLGLAMLTVGLVTATYAARADADGHRFPQFSAGATGTAVFPTFRVLDDDQPFSVVLIAPRGHGAPLPPGVDKWPAPGQAVVSPALVAEGVGGRLGQVVSTIDRSGLAVPDERLAYVRPVGDELPESAQVATGFGYPPQSSMSVGRSGALFGESMTIHPLEFPLVGVLIFMVVPALGLLWTACRLHLRERRSRELTMEALGASPGTRLVAWLGPLVVPILAGIVLSVIAVAITVSVGVELPVTGFVLDGSLLAGFYGVLGVCVGVALILAFCIASIRPRRRPSTRPALVLERFPTAATLVGPTALVAAVYLPDIVAPQGGYLWTVTYWVCVLLVMVSLPLAAAAVLSGLAAAARPWVRRRGWPSAVIPGGILARVPSFTLALIAGVLVFGVLSSQAVLWTRVFGSQVAAAQSAKSDAHDEVLLLEPRVATNAAAFMNELRPNNILLLDTSTPDRSVIRGQCSTLQELGLECAQGQVASAQLPRSVRAVTSYFGNRTLMVEPIEKAQAENWRPGSQVLVVSSRGPLAIGDVSEKASALLAGSPAVEWLGTEWIAGAESDRQQGRWIVLFAALGFLSAGGAVALGLAESSLRYQRRLAPVLTVSGSTVAYWRINLWLVLIPFIIAGVLGAITSRLLASPVSVAMLAEPPTLTHGVALVVACTALGLTSYVGVAYASIRQGRTWVGRGRE